MEIKGEGSKVLLSYFKAWMEKVRLDTIRQAFLSDMISSRQDCSFTACFQRKLKKVGENPKDLRFSSFHSLHSLDLDVPSPEVCTGSTFANPTWKGAIENCMFKELRYAEITKVGLPSNLFSGFKDWGTCPRFLMVENKWLAYLEQGWAEPSDLTS